MKVFVNNLNYVSVSLNQNFINSFLGERKMDYRKTVLMVMFLVAFTLTTSAAIRDSADFEGVLYEADQLPHAASPVWDLASDTASVSTAGGLLRIDTMAGGSSSWYLPGAYGAESAPAANRNYTNGDLSNPFDPDIVNLGYTVEMSVEMLDSSPGTFGLSLYWGEANGGALSDIQIFKDRITHSGGTVYYTGDLTGSQHRIRLSRQTGLNSTPSDLPEVDLYVDDAYVTTMESYTIGGTLANSAWNQDWMYLGSLAGVAQYDAEIDYIRFDFSGAYEPVPEPASLILFGSGVVLYLRKRK
jgi:hypothetical protein